MQTSKFTENSAVKSIIDDLNRFRKSQQDNFIYSDVIDGKGHQYVDLVQEGGGMLGIALVGYTYVLEQMGIRFVSLAGTSAGAINTLLLGALGKPEEMKSLKLIELIASKDFYDFVDGDSDARKFIRALNDKSGFLKLLFRGLQILDNLKKDKGLNPGDSFYTWLTKVLDNANIHNTRDLYKNMNQFPNDLQYRPEVKGLVRNIHASLAIIATDLTTETKVEFPRMASLYFDDPDLVSPAQYVRASMSIPLFFKPFEIKGIPQSEDSKNEWLKLTLFKGDIPDKVHMVDGGILSNFPIDVFHISTKLPSRPTFGVKLGLEKIKINPIENYRKLVEGCWNTASQMRDFEFIFKNPDFSQLVATIDTGDHDWLDFAISDDAKVDLFVKGAKAAEAFLKKFDWRNYKEIRRHLMADTFVSLWNNADEKTRMLA